MKKSTKIIIWVVAGVLILALIILLVWYFLFAKRDLSKTDNQNSSKPQSTASQSQAQKFTKKLFFIHHSTGEIYWNGGMQKALADAGYETSAPWWDANTDPGDFYGDFTDSNQWQILEPYSIIVFKSCFPASAIESDETLAQYKEYYLKLYEIYSAHPDKLFVPMSTPPLLKNHTSAEAAQRALAFESWLVGEYKQNYRGKNLAPFKLHSLLSDSEGYLKSDFIASQEDDHPNNYSGEIVGPALVQHLEQFVQ
jgi:hypothetical protein